MIKAVIFDVDGTLVDTVDAHAEAWRKAFEHFGKSIAFDAIRSQIGKGGDQLLPVFLDDAECDTIGPKIEAYSKDVFKREFMPSVRGFPAVRDLFLAIADRGFRISLASSAKGEELEGYKKAAGITGLPDVETSSDDAERSKPHPDIFQAALDRLKLGPQAAIVIGDTPYDAEAASKAGMDSIGLLCGGFPAEAIRRAGASRIYDDPAALLAAIDEWLPRR